MTDSAPPAPIEHRMETAHGHIHVDEYPGEGPAIVLMHGYPDDSRIYDRLLPELAPRRVVTFDFPGYGRSGREAAAPVESGRREGELAAVVEALGLDRPVVVGHDSSGPVAINYTLGHPDRVSRLVLLNTYYGGSPTLQFPELIRLYADPHFTLFADALTADQNVLGWALLFTDSRLREGPFDPAGLGATSILPQFFGDATQPDAIAAIRAWTAELFEDMGRQEAHLAAGDLADLHTPVSLAFGADDPYFNPGVAEHLRAAFKTADAHEIPGAAHWPQWDQPAAAAAVIAGQD